MQFALSWVFPNWQTAICEIALTLGLSMWYFARFNGMELDNKIRNAQKFGGAGLIMILTATFLEYVHETAAKLTAQPYDYNRMWLPVVFTGGCTLTIILGDWIVFILHEIANHDRGWLGQQLAAGLRKIRARIGLVVTLVLVALLFSACDKLTPDMLTAIAASNTQAAQTATARVTPAVPSLTEVTVTPVTTVTPIDVTATPAPSETGTSSATPTGSIIEVTPCGQAICEVTTPTPEPSDTAAPSATSTPFKTQTLTATPAPSKTATATSPATSTKTPTPRPPTDTPTPVPVTPTPSPITPTPPGGPQPSAFPGNWREIFNDEFDKAGLDLTKWEPGWFYQSGNKYTQYVNSSEGQCFSSDNVRQPGDGSVYLDLAKGTCPSSAGKSAGLPYVGAAITTRPHFTFTFGVVETRMWVGGATQSNCLNWDSFWINSAATGSGQREYDLAECLGGKFAVHFNPGSTFGGDNGKTSGALAHGDLLISGGWHVFSALWDNTGVTVKVDGVTYGRLTNVYSAPMYIIYENATHGTSNVVAPDTMRIDYVRVWQK